MNSAAVTVFCPASVHLLLSVCREQLQLDAFKQTEPWHAAAAERLKVKYMLAFIVQKNISANNENLDLIKETFLCFLNMKFPYMFYSELVFMFFQEMASTLAQKHLRSIILNVSMKF